MARRIRARAVRLLVLAVPAAIGSTSSALCTTAAGVGGAMPLSGQAVRAGPAFLPAPSVPASCDAAGLILHLRAGGAHGALPACRPEVRSRRNAVLPTLTALDQYCWAGQRKQGGVLLGQDLGGRGSTGPVGADGQHGAQRSVGSGDGGAVPAGGVRSDAEVLAVQRPVPQPYVDVLGRAARGFTVAAREHLVSHQRPRPLLSFHAYVVEVVAAGSGDHRLRQPHEGSAGGDVDPGAGARPFCVHTG